MITVSVTMPGSVGDKHVLLNSALYENCHELFLDHQQYVLADGGYYSLPWMVIPFQEPRAPAVLSVEHRYFNYMHSKVRVIVECAFGRLKNRFRALLEAVPHKLVPYMIKCIIACMVLHNICIIHHPASDEEALEVLLGLDDDLDPDNEQGYDPNDVGDVVYVPPTALGLRDHLVQHVFAQL